MGKTLDKVTINMPPSVINIPPSSASTPTSDSSSAATPPASTPPPLPVMSLPDRKKHKRGHDLDDELSSFF